jgi:hypothetical protein
MASWQARTRKRLSKQSRTYEQQVVTSMIKETWKITLVWMWRNFLTDESSFHNHTSSIRFLTRPIYHHDQLARQSLHLHPRYCIDMQQNQHLTISFTIVASLENWIFLKRALDRTLLTWHIRLRDFLKTQNVHMAKLYCGSVSIYAKLEMMDSFWIQDWTNLLK